MTITEKLISLLDTFQYPVFRQGSLSDDEEYPHTFFTFWNYSSPEDIHYDNNPQRTVCGFYLYVYSVDTEKVTTLLSDAVDLLKENGWIREGKGIDVSSDEPTHTGRMVRIQYIENY